MPTAYLHLPEHVAERRLAFTTGLENLGFRILAGQPSTPLRHDDVVVTWNVTARSSLSAEMARIGGGAHIVVENGYIGQDESGWQYYAMALDGHCGSGRWYAPDDSRLDALQLDFKPWRDTPTRQVLLAAQRGIGSPLMRSPPHWDTNTLRELTRRGYEGRVRPHPGVDKEGGTPLLADLEDMEAIVVWSSNCATKALVNGIPAYYTAPHIITAGAAAKLQHIGKHNFTDEARHEAFARLSWAQWTLAEITSGEAINTLLQVHKGRLPACRKS